ncbi:MAG: HmuY family protein [Pseudobacter sp.]|uniref:HmuY family protein n=1 Tax=Pseudobacter sp. TaxID=2045420 RepID=UPI003F80A019
MLFRITALMLMLTTVFSACEKDDPPMADNLIQFEAADQGLGTDVNSKDITIKLSRNSDAAIPVTVELTETGVVYGTHYTTSPAAAAGIITLTIPAGSNSVSFNVTKKADILLNGDESVSFNIKAAGTPVGQTTKLKLSFGSIVSTGTSLELNGGEGGSSAVNHVFVDFSNNVQTAVNRKVYDLKFASGADWRVLLNNVAGWAAVKTNKTDINAVNEGDVTLASMQIGYGFGTLAMIDDVEGDITKNAMGEVSATESDNKVFLVSTAGATFTPPAITAIKKIRVLRNANGYTLQYADINATTFQTLTIEKNSAYNFRFASFATGVVSVEPAKDRWDIVWGWSFYKAFDDVTSKWIPYAYSDLVFSNRSGNVQAAEVLTSTVSYADFKESNIAAVTFDTRSDAIGAKWRLASQTGAGVYTDRFYVVKDGAGNVYKLKFVNFHPSDGGKRGYPNIEYKLVKKA